LETFSSAFVIVVKAVLSFVSQPDKRSSLADQRRSWGTVTAVAFCEPLFE
jgi:hypothetical protein